MEKINKRIIEEDLTVDQQRELHKESSICALRAQLVFRFQYVHKVCAALLERIILKPHTLTPNSLQQGIDAVFKEFHPHVLGEEFELLNHIEDFRDAAFDSLSKELQKVRDAIKLWRCEEEKLDAEKNELAKSIEETPSEEDLQRLVDIDNRKIELKRRYLAQISIIVRSFDFAVPKKNVAVEKKS